MDVLADVLAANRIGGAVVAHLRACGEWGCGIDRLDQAAFHVISRGTCWLRLRGRDPVRLDQGDIAILPTGVEHVLATRRDGPVTPYGQLAAENARGGDGAADLDLGGDGALTKVICGKFQYASARPHPVLVQLPEVVHVPASGAGADADLQSLIRLLVSELDHPRPGGKTTLTRLSDVLFIYALRAWSASNEPTRPGWLYGLRDPDIAAALAGMHACPERPWSVEDLAATANLSRAAFARRFTALVGEPPLVYLTRWRMELAARHLRESDELVARIAERVGYRSEYAFSRAFSRMFDEPPGRYRRAHRVAEERHRHMEGSEAN